jgi:DNA polymerase III alpha subunit (gram-positive type)
MRDNKIYMTSTLEALQAEIETIIMVDVETAGPIPSLYPLLSIGACTIQHPRKTFYIELQPDRMAAETEALAVSHLALEDLLQSGTPPLEAMRQFEIWLKEQIQVDKPIFSAFNAPFDWMFINDYFIRYLGHNPFGHNALDVRPLYMGMRGVSWGQSSMRMVSHHYLESRSLTHHALQDAQDQADMLAGIMRDLMAESEEE